MFGQEPDGAFFPAIAEGLHGEEVRRPCLGRGKGLRRDGKECFQSPASYGREKICRPTPQL